MHGRSRTFFEAFALGAISMGRSRCGLPVVRAKILDVLFEKMNGVSRVFDCLGSSAQCLLQMTVG
jgi:hypothetical protein